MRVSIVACGDSAKDWVPNGLSIGVNDCWKWGKPTDYLVVVNSPVKFNPNARNGNVNRLKTIIDSKPKRFFCHNSNWKPYFPEFELLTMKTFIGNYNPGRVYSSQTSPMVAITLAASQGAKEIIIWGVDFVNHHKFSAKALGKYQNDFKTELGHYRDLFEAMERKGIKCFVGNENTVLKEFLLVYPHGIDEAQTHHNYSKQFTS